MKKVLVTGAAGFIGFHTVKKLIIEGFDVVGFDNLNDYYDVSLKIDRLRECGIQTAAIEDLKYIISDKYPTYKFIKMDLLKNAALMDLFRYEQFDYVIHLAAQAGVRYSIENPTAYIKSNIEGFHNILEACRHYPVLHLTYASSSSVYGNNEEIPFSVDHNVDKPVSLYAATKKSNELMAHTYSHLFKIPTTGLRFFTVYGPWGRPDMAPTLFAEAIVNNKSINVFNNGEMERDFTYIDDIVDGILSVNTKSPLEYCKNEEAPYAIHNIGNSDPIKLMDFISCLESYIGAEAKKNFLPMQSGDVKRTYADIDSLKNCVGYEPFTPLECGIRKFIEWFLNYKIQKQSKAIA